MQSRLQSRSRKILIGLLALSLLMIPVSAMVTVDNYENNIAYEKALMMDPAMPWYDPDDIGKDAAYGGAILTKWFPSTTQQNGKGTESVTVQSMVGWQVQTDIWRDFLGPVRSIHYSRARDSSGLPVDIQQIKVEGKVYYAQGKSGYSQVFSQTDADWNDSDAEVRYKSDYLSTAGKWFAKGIHYLYNSPREKWTPITSDSIS